MLEPEFLKRLVSYDYKKSPAYIKMTDIAKNLSKEEKIDFFKEDTKIFKKCINEETQNKIKALNEDLEQEEDYDKLKDLLLFEETRERELIEKNKISSREVIERELELERVLLYQSEQKNKISVLKDSPKEINDLKIIQKEINEKIDLMKNKLGENIINKERNIITYYNKQIEGLKEMFKKEFHLQIEK